MPQKSRSRLGFLSGYASRRIAMGSEWRRSMCARMRRTITELRVDERRCFAILLAFRFLRRCGHRQVNPPALAVSPFVQTRDDFFNGPPNTLDVSPLVATDGVLPLHDDVAVPACTDHVAGRVCRLHGYDFVVFYVQGLMLCYGLLARDRLTPMVRPAY